MTPVWINYRLDRNPQLKGRLTVTPVLMPGEEPPVIEPFEMTSGYLQRARGVMPKSADALPWRLEQDYLIDQRWMKASPVDDGILTFDRALASIAVG